MDNRKLKLSYLVGIFFTIYSYFSYASSLGQININPQMKKHIMQSQFKALLQRSDGKKFMAYLYADDEISKKLEAYSCINGKLQTTASKTGHYKIYLYDLAQDVFLPKSKKVFEELGEITLNVEGADLVVLSGGKQKKSDVLLISQFGACNGNAFEAYGFSKTGLFLKNYTFVGKKKDSQFYGRVGNVKRTSRLVAFSFTEDNGIINKILTISNKYGEIKVKVGD